jgi:glycosyltransferase involved in cell wall biosynthesis
LARDLEISERVAFRGYVPPTKLDEERRAADVFVVPLADSTMSRHFTSPLKLFEAMAAGRPIVASDLPSIREVLTDGSNALLVPPGDAGALAQAIKRLASDRELRADLARQASKDIAKYSWDERGRRIAALLNDVVRGQTA